MTEVHKQEHVSRESRGFPTSFQSVRGSWETVRQVAEWTIRLKTFFKKLMTFLGEIKQQEELKENVHRMKFRPEKFQISVKKPELSAKGSWITTFSKFSPSTRSIDFIRVGHRIFDSSATSSSFQYRVPHLLMGWCRMSREKPPNLFMSASYWWVLSLGTLQIIFLTLHMLCQLPYHWDIEYRLQKPCANTFWVLTAVHAYFNSY